MRILFVIVAGLALLSATLLSQSGWSTLRPPTSRQLWGVTTIEPDKVFAVGFNGVLLRSTDAGLSWTVDSLMYGGKTWTLSFIECADSNNLWAGHSGSPTFRSTDGGITWSEFLIDSVASITRVQFVSPQLGFASGFEWFSPCRGRILRTTDAGSTWHLLLDTAGRAFNDVCFVDSLLGVAVGSSNPVFDNFDPEIIFRTSDGGVTWEYIPAPGDGPLESVHMRDQANGIAAGANAHLLTTSDGGKTWTQRGLSLPANYGIHAVTLTDSAEAWAVVGALGNVYHSFNNGETWCSTSLPGATSIFGIHFASDGRGYAVGSSGGVWQYSPATGTTDNGLDQSVPSFALTSYPNPFNPTTTIRFTVDENRDVCLFVVDVLGRRVADLLSGSFTPGPHSVIFDGSSLAAGTYFAILTIGPRRGITKILLIH